MSEWTAFPEKETGPGLFEIQIEIQIFFYRILKGQYFGFKIFTKNENFLCPDWAIINHLGG
jgi:hypothetical protein